MYQSRNNIMFRRIKPYTGHNQLSANTDYARQQQKLLALRKRRQAVQNFRKVSLYPDKAQSSHLQQFLYNQGQCQIEYKQNIIQQEHQKERAEYLEMERYRLESIQKQQEKYLAKRASFREASEHNRLAAERKSVENLRARKQEKINDRETIQRAMSNFRPNLF